MNNFRASFLSKISVKARRNILQIRKVLFLELKYGIEVLRWSLNICIFLFISLLFISPKFAM